MPKIKSKKSKKPTRGKKSGIGVRESVAAMFSRYTIAAAAGLTVVLAIGAAILWSGGYFGLMAERATTAADRAAIMAGFEIRRVTAKGYENISESELLAALGPVVGASLVGFDPYAAKARIEEIGWVRSAAVSRLWPNTVHLSVRERAPAAVWQLAGAMHLVDQTGAIIREVDAFEYSNLPLIVGAGAPASASGILQALRAEPALWGSAAALIRVGDRRWNVRFNSGADVKLPEVGYQQSIRQLAALQDAYGVLDRDLEYIDLRNAENIVYRAKNGAALNLE